MSKIDIWAADPADAELIATFIHELACYQDLKTELSIPRLRAHLEHVEPRIYSFIANLDGKPVGFALFYHTFSTFLVRRTLYLEDIFVREKARGQGVGRALMKRVAQHAINNDCAALDFNVLTHNTTAQEFYRHLGAHKVHEWDPFYLAGKAISQLAT